MFLIDSYFISFYLKNNVYDKNIYFLLKQKRIEVHEQRKRFLIKEIHFFYLI